MQLLVRLCNTIPYHQATASMAAGQAAAQASMEDVRAAAGRVFKRAVFSEATLQHVNDADAARRNTVAEGLQYRAPQLSWTSQTYNDVKGFAGHAGHRRCTRSHSARTPDRAPKRSQGRPSEPSHMHQTCCTKPAVHNTAAGWRRPKMQGETLKPPHACLACCYKIRAGPLRKPVLLWPQSQCLALSSSRCIDSPQAPWSTL